ncbi:MAG: cyclase family protein [Alphaproteobacteria bacterium]|nr:cyclase family protein [Alphaproteobacteria bacterium]
MVFPYKAIDLTHTLKESIPAWDKDCGFHLGIDCDYPDCTTDVKFRAQKIAMDAGLGTHMDAPAHCIPGGLTIDKLPLQNLIAPCVVIDVSEHAHEHYSLSVQDIETFESLHGTIPPQTFVLVRTGWATFWDEPAKYHNNYAFPSVSVEAARFLLERKIVGLGIDTLSPDRPDDAFAVHATLLGAGKFMIENVANAHQLPPLGSFILALPIKIGGGTEAPIRLIALVNDNTASI